MKLNEYAKSDVSPQNISVKYLFLRPSKPNYLLKRLTRVFRNFAITREMHRHVTHRIRNIARKYLLGLHSFCFFRISSVDCFGN